MVGDKVEKIKATLSSSSSSDCRSCCACSGALCANKPDRKALAWRREAFFLPHAYVHVVPSANSYRPSTPSSSRASPNNARQCCFIPALRAGRRRAAPRRLAVLLCDYFSEVADDALLATSGVGIAGLYDVYEPQMRAREQHWFLWPPGDESWCLARSGRRS